MGRSQNHLEERRALKRLFGTDGIRGTAGRFPLDSRTVGGVGRALASSLAPMGGRSPRILIGRDTRESGPAIEEAFVRGIEAAGGDAHRGGVLTTPAVASLTRMMGFQAGAVISASHNPHQDNGIKIFSDEGFKLPDAMEATIEALVLDGAASEPGATSPSSAGPTTRVPSPEDVPTPATAGEDLPERYIASLLATLAPGTSLAGWRIVLDCAHGAATLLGPELFRRAGAEVTALNTTPDGRNINQECGALHPQHLARTVKECGAHLGLAFDGDADRCHVVDGSGRVLDGDYVLYLAARDLKSSGSLTGSTVVATVMSNLWLEKALHQEGIALRRAAVGDKYVLEEMRRGGYVLGGEQSGHIIFLDRATTGDGLLTGLVLLDLLRRSGLDLADWAATIHPCPQILVNVPVHSKPSLDSHPTIGPSIREEEKRLGEQGRVLVRYSGTEPKARVMVEGSSRDDIEACAARLKNLIQEAIGQKPS
jgi:phosphoglucosamine mutase